jgi:hypothetical protein
MVPELVNHLWQSTLFAAAVGLLALAVRKNHARVRYWLWLSASVKFLIPFSLFVAIGSYFAPPRTVPIAQTSFSMVQEIGQPFTAPAGSVLVVHSVFESFSSHLICDLALRFLLASRLVGS